LRKILIAAAALALLVPVAAAQADPVQEFSFQLRDIKPDGRFTVLFTSRSYDTSGGQPPLLTSNYLRLPFGAKLQRTFLNHKYYCDVRKLLADLQGAPETNMPFFKRVENLKATLKRVRSRLNKGAIKNAKVCIRARIGQGSVDVDARPLFNELIPAKIYMFLSKAQTKGDVAAFGILGIPDETAPVVKDNPIIANTRVPVYLRVVNEPSPDKLYGYKLILPAGPIAGVRVNITRVDVTNTGLTLIKKKRVCTKRSHGKCVKRKVKKRVVFWFNQPPCPPSGKLSFQAFYQYETGATFTRTIQLACPNFRA
jgi:hypothetical protein